MQHADMTQYIAQLVVLRKRMTSCTAVVSQRQNWVQDLSEAQLLQLMWLLLILPLLLLLLPLLLLQQPRRWQAQWAIEIIFHGEDGQ
jgi:hypothetical protein